MMKKYCSEFLPRRAGAIVRVVRLMLATLFACCTLNTLASLGAYDAAITNDAAAGLAPVAKLTNAVTLTGANRAAFDFGINSGDVTIEFVLQGNPSAGGASAYLAVGANTGSNLRYEQYNNTGQLGFTQLGVADYLFSPVVPSPIQPTHIAYVWNAATRTMTLYVNGSVAGTSSGVSANFAMPTGVGWLGANPSSTETMTGTIYRVTVYDDMVPADAIQRHADAYNDVVRLPIIVSFAANPSAVFTPGSSTLTWNVQRAAGLFINGVDVTAAPNFVVSPTTTTTYTLSASNAGGIVTAQTTVLVNPPPIISSFTASKAYVGSGETAALTWNVSYGQMFSISPGVGDVTAQTVNGTGSVNVQPLTSTTYTLTASSTFGTNSATVEMHVVQPANHLVISEFMADNESTLADQDGDFPDWIEIHNPTAAAVNLAGHFLTDDDAEPTKWAFPNLNLAAGAYLVVFASGKDRTNTAASLHTNFQLNNDGEYLALVGPGPVLLHAFAPAFPPQRNDISYGILGNDVSIERYMGVPTPGTPNDETPAPPAPVQFSQPSGLFTNAFSLRLTNPDPAAVIRFTLNGSTPSATNGSAYLAPLTVTNTTRIRAVALVSNQTSRITGASYIRLANDLVGYTSSLPIMVIENFGAGVIPVKPFNGNGAGIRQAPRQFAAWATFDRNSGISSLTNPPQMFGHIGVRARGGASSQWRQKPLSVEGIDDEGAERALSPLGLPAHADWILYFPDADTANSKDATMLFNTFAFELSAKSGRYSVRFRWVEAFLNEDGGDLRLADRRGVYAIVEKVSRGEDRLDFERLSTDGTNGGWLLNINRMDSEPDYGWPAANGATQPWFFHTAGQNRILQTADNALPVQGDDEPQQINAFINFDNPNGYTINTNQRAGIQNWFKQFEDVLWNNAIWRDPVNGYRKYVDVVDFADFFVVNVLTRNSDGLLISIFPWKGDDNKLRMGPVWDFNYNTYYISGGPTGSLYHRSERLWYRRIFADPDFLQLYIDRWWEHRRGPMSNAALDAIIDGQAADISAAKAILNGVPSATEWTNRLNQLKTWLKDRANWIDSNYLRPPVFNANGGDVPDGFNVAIFGTNGTIYFTADGSDPRASGGAVAASAQAYQAPFPLSAQTFVQARVKNGTNWSALTAAVFRTPQDFTKLAVTEIMYNPPAFGAWPGDELEFLELKNIGTNTLNLGTLTFTAGITFTFTNGTLLMPGQFFVVARNAAAFQSRYPGVEVKGIYSGRLDNSGETLRVSTPVGNTVLAVTYNDRAPWPLAPDGYGFSIVPANTLAPDNSDNGSHWRGSTALGGSPGADDSAPTIPSIVINEILTQTDPPQVDAVELFNPTAQNVDIGGWFLSDDGTVPKKFRIPSGTLIPGGSYVVFTETNFNPTPATLFNFSLSSAGDSIYFSSGDAATNLTGYSHGVSFGAAANGVSFGRYVNSAGEEQFPAQVVTTLSATNAGPVVGPVVISEIMYHPEIGSDEFIELRNITPNAVPLFEAAHPTNTWRVNGLGFIFPTNIVLPSNGLALIVATNPAAFRTKHSVPAEVLVLGPFAGELQDSGERLELQRPEWRDTNGVVYITIDEVRYNDKAPWPPGADGGGPSLQRRIPAAYGNDPINWEAAVATPGVDFVSGQAPIITAQPQSRTIVAYRDAAFSVSATGPEPLFYQWLFDGDPIFAATNSALVLTNVQPSQAGNYHVVAYNSSGSATSADAQLTVLIPAIIHQQPQNVVTNAGRNVTFSVSAVGTGTLQYQWRLNGANISGATNFSLALTNVQLTNEGVYTVVIVDNVGDVTSAPARLAVLFDPVIIQHPISQSIPTGGTVTISIVVTNNATLPLGYRLRRNGVTLPETFISTNEWSAFFTITNIRAPLVNFAISVTNAAQPAGRNSNTALMTLLPDTDGDGIPDAWEAQFGFNTNSAADGLLDSDGDKMLNWQEWFAGTDPTNAASYLKFDAIAAGGGATLAFGAASGRTYTVEFTDTLGNGTWLKLTNIVARSADHTEQILDPNYTTNRFYRLVTPRQP